MELWDIYNEKKEKTGRTMKRNDWNMKPDEFHLTVLGPAPNWPPVAVTVPPVMVMFLPLPRRPPPKTE